MPETLGSGVCVFDYDGDDRPDIFLVQSGRLPGYRSEAPPRSALYRNLGGGRFEEATDRAGLGGPDRYGFGCTAADVDGDGDRDLYITFVGPNVLFRNNGDGTFTDVTAAAGVGDPLWSASAGFADADGDGDLDLYVANYVDYSIENNIYCGENRPGYRTVCHPKNFDALPDTFYRNRGDGTFANATAAAGMTEHTGKGLGVVWGDYDGDGDEDLYVANDDTPNFLWRNRGGGRFEDVGPLAGVALSEDGIPQAGMGTDMSDYDNDGRLDIFVTNLSEETKELYHNDGNGVFSDRTFASGIGGPSLLTLAFGTFFFDPDDDGNRDLFYVNGHIIATSLSQRPSPSDRPPSTAPTGTGASRSSGGRRGSRSGGRTSAAARCRSITMTTGTRTSCSSRTTAPRCCSGTRARRRPAGWAWRFRGVRRTPRRSARG
jgi:hypothetical protein